MEGDEEGNPPWVHGEDRNRGVEAGAGHRG